MRAVDINVIFCYVCQHRICRVTWARRTFSVSIVRFVIRLLDPYACHASCPSRPCQFLIYVEGCRSDRVISYHFKQDSNGGHALDLFHHEFQLCDVHSANRDTHMNTHNEIYYKYDLSMCARAWQSCQYDIRATADTGRHNQSLTLYCRPYRRYQRWTAASVHHSKYSTASNKATMDVNID